VLLRDNSQAVDVDLEQGCEYGASWWVWACALVAAADGC